MISKPPTNDQIAAELALFYKDPVAAMNRQPHKTVVQDPGRGAPVPLAPYAQGSAFVTQRDQVRKKTCGERDGQLIRLDQIAPGRAPFQRNDLAEDLVDVPAGDIIRTLDGMEGKQLQSARLQSSPWSSTYWPLYQGQTGARYADPDFPADKDWKVNRAYVEQSPASDIVASGRQAAIDNLSPAEKYDLLLGDEDFTLTQAAWRSGKQQYDRNGSVETWMGICHGWSPAAYMLPRPVRIVTLTAADGSTKLNFFPDDIKALGCLLWATTNPRSHFIGGRCNDKGPALDPDNGRVISQDCFDTNPGTWHVSVVNQLGVAGRSMIIDATFDYEVWNQPLLGYAYGYFNPQTGKPVTTLKDARIDRRSFTNDKFARYRAPNAHHMVGVFMQLTYIAETLPKHDSSDNASLDRQVQVGYQYDLEHDENGAIIGGEWYINRHPDFLWTPPPGGVALSSQDDAVSGAWSGGVLADTWRDAAIAAAGDGQPLAKIVNALFDLAK